MLKIGLFLISFLFAANLIAGGFFEPSLGYNSGKYEDPERKMLLVRDDGFAKGVDLSFKFGYSGSLIFLGGNLGFRIMVLETDFAWTDSNEAFIGIKPGLIAGVHVPGIPIRIWGAIYGGVLASGHEEVVLQTKWSSVYTTRGVTLGLGWRIFPLLSLNFEFSNEKLPKVKRTVENTLLNTKIEDTIEFENQPTIKTFMISLSIPIEFWK